MGHNAGSFGDGETAPLSFPDVIPSWRARKVSNSEDHTLPLPQDLGASTNER
jgi:hypothetical protein